MRVRHMDDDRSGSDVVESDIMTEPKFTVEMQQSLYVAHNRRTRSPQPVVTKASGKLRFVGSGLPPKFLSAFEVRDLAGLILRDLSSGNLEQMLKSLAYCYTAFRGDQGKLSGLCTNLLDELDSLGIIVKCEDKALIFHDVDSAYALEFQFDRDIDFENNSMFTTVTAKPYDWNSKKDVPVEPVTVLAGLCGKVSGKAVWKNCVPIDLSNFR